MIIDTHCHYNLKPLSDDTQQHWQKAQENGVEAAITVGTDLENSKLALEIANKFPNIYASIGLHPGNYTEAIKTFLNGNQYSQDKIDKFINKEIKKITQLLNKEIKNSKLVAIGEIGLDYYRLRTKGLKRDLVIKMQKKIFEVQLKLAFQHNLVAIIHVRDQNDRYQNENNAYFDTLDILKKAINSFTQKITANKTQITNSTLTYPKFILHCISGPESYIKEAISMGAYFGVAGNVTYDNAQNLRQIIKNLPNNKILLETDAPYLTPKDFDGQICEPRMIKTTAEFLQKKMNLNLDIIKNNTTNLFYDKIH